MEIAFIKLLIPLIEKHPLAVGFGILFSYVPVIFYYERDKRYKQKIIDSLLKKNTALQEKIDAYVDLKIKTVEKVTAAIINQDNTMKGVIKALDKLSEAFTNFMIRGDK